MSFYSYEGPSLAVEKKAAPYDMHCKLMMSRGLNYYKSSCLERQSDPLQKDTCYPACKADQVLNKNNSAKRSGEMNGIKTKIAEMFERGLTTSEVMDEKPAGSKLTVIERREENDDGCRKYIQPHCVQM